jgi:hypothetical protein
LRRRRHRVFSSQSGAQFLISRSDGETCDHGSSYTEDGSRIVLCDATCQFVQSEVGGILELLFGCETIDVVH